ncbi:YncE family protein [Mycobacterium sp.]|uniref:YncE family protein n=1 Tax=Mycobacterium sp. TaxID=1785 RepID=UPI003A848C5B
MIPGVLTACSSDRLKTTPRTIEPATPAVSPPASTPAGRVLELGGHPQAALFDGGTGQLVVLSPGTDPGASADLRVFGGRDASGGIALPTAATAMTGDGAGTAYLASHGGYITVDLGAGRATAATVAGAQDVDFTAITRRADGSLALGSADGAVYLLTADNSVANRTQIFARVDALAAQGNTTIVLDRGQTSVTTLDADGNAQQSLRAGTGATTLVADPHGRVLVADTRGGQLLVYGVDPLILRQAFPVRHSPYGLAASQKLAWVSQTESNTVVGYDLSTGIPVEKVRYPTVRQPNSLAYDEVSGTLYVVSGSGAGVQVIEHAAGTP